jgi:hypothetical protein
MLQQPKGKIGKKKQQKKRQATKCIKMSSIPYCHASIVTSHWRNVEFIFVATQALIDDVNNLKN